MYCDVLRLYLSVEPQSSPPTRGAPREMGIQPFTNNPTANICSKIAPENLRIITPHGGMRRAVLVGKLSGLAVAHAAC